ncbi:bifunctional diguanylate cyclase/phosphodiesterase [Kineosporia sp. A_224]|uniref:putative bifunctional diguanylate cyclase/phosphodiesterase n=1 Tax=Kineosporia sp. A_224 TaxID=1962180 RepID=UPI001179A3CA|nr:bifunctional diguanylate cyclase/phosphodiesterase [Kineosporia sp. A_224]
MTHADTPGVTAGAERPTDAPGRVPAARRRASGAVLAVLAGVAVVAGSLVVMGINGLVPVTSVAVGCAVAAALGWSTARAARAVRRLETGAMTGLPNRHVFERALDELLGRPDRAQGTVMSLLDLDDLKNVDRQLGRRATDTTVRACVRIWRDRLPAGASLYDLERGRFALLLPGAVSGDAVAVVDRLRSNLPYPGTVTAGIGRYCAGDTLALLTTRAGASLHRAKLAGKNCVDPDAWTQTLGLEIGRGLARGEFYLAYQPIVRLDTGEVVGCEALLRWAHPVRGPVPPGDFIPVAEATGTICDLDWFALTTAVQTLATTTEPPAGLLRLGVNVTGADLRRPGYADTVLALLETAGLAPERLVLEVTESILGDDQPVAVAALSRLREGGVRIAIDDFGTGYSSLGRIGSLPIDIIKIDRLFVATQESSRGALLAAVVALAQALGADVVAEGIETRDQAQLVLDTGCVVGQGYLLGRPGAFDDVLRLSSSAASHPGEGQAPAGAGTRRTGPGTTR